MKTIIGIFKTYGIVSFHVMMLDTELQIINLETSDVSKYAFEQKCIDIQLQTLSADEKAELDALFDSPHDEPTVDLDFVSGWLDVLKGNLFKTLRASYTSGVDFVVSKPVSSKGRGMNTRRIVMLTPKCFKMLCMQSNARQADRVRAYLLLSGNLILGHSSATISTASTIKIRTLN